MMMGKVEAEQARVTLDHLVWVVVKAKPGQERRAAHELRCQHFEVYLPMRLFENRKGVTMATPFLPGYLFAQVTLRVERWKSIYSTLGVAGVLGRPECPIGVRDHVVQRIRDAEEGGFIKLALAKEERSTLQFGRYYRDEDTGIEGLLVEPLDDKRVVMLTRLLGDSRATVDIARLKLIEDCPAPEGSPAPVR
jgi:hypothetical protein